MSTPISMEHHMVSLLTASVAEAGSIRAWAGRFGISPSQVSDAVRGKVPVPPVIADALGFTPVRVYVKTHDTAKGDPFATRPRGEGEG